MDKVLKSTLRTQSKLKKIDKRKTRHVALVHREVEKKKKSAAKNLKLKSVSSLLESIEEVEHNDLSDVAYQKQLLRKVNYPIPIGKSGVTPKTRRLVE